MTSIELAAVVVAGTALVLAPIDPQPIRDLNTPPVEPAVVAHYTIDGTCWGHDTITATEEMLARAHDDGLVVHEWHVTDCEGWPLRITRIIDPSGFDTTSVIPAMPARPTAAQLPTTPTALADRIQAVGDANLLADLTAQIGGREARYLLAEAHGIVSDRLWNS